MQTQPTPNYQNYQAPPPPPIFNEQTQRQQFNPPKHRLYCVKCGTTHNVKVHNFQKRFVPSAARLAILLGPLIYVIVRLILTTRHNISTNFCENCWKWFRFAEYFDALFKLGFLFILLFGITIGVVLNSIIVGVIIVGLSVVCLFVGQNYIEKISPKYKLIDEKKVIIGAPIGGEIIFWKEK